jgi:hypothetical protein
VPEANNGIQFCESGLLKTIRRWALGAGRAQELGTVLGRKLKSSLGDVTFGAIRRSNYGGHARRARRFGHAAKTASARTGAKGQVALVRANGAKRITAFLMRGKA